MPKYCPDFSPRIFTITCPRCSTGLTSTTPGQENHSAIKQGAGEVLQQMQLERLQREQSIPSASHA